MNGTEVEVVLAQRIVLSDPLAAPMLISVHGDQLLGLVHSMAPGLADSERGVILELALERGIGTFREFESGSDSVLTWFSEQVRLQVRQWIRDHPTSRPDETDIVMTSSPVRAFDSAVVADLAAIVATLNYADSLMLALRNWHGLAYSTIGELLGIKEQTARQKTKRALDKLELAIRKDKSDRGHLMDYRPRGRQMNSSPLKRIIWTHGLEVFDLATLQAVEELLGYSRPVSPEVRRQLIMTVRRALRSQSR